MVLIVILILASAAIALALHAIIRRYLVAVLATGIVIDGWLFLLRTGGAWTAKDTFILALASTIAISVSAIVGVWPAALRKRRKAAIPGFDVIKRQP
jgi:urea transporter